MVSTNLQKVFHAFSIVAIALSTNAFHFLDLTGLASRLNVLEMHIWVLAEVDNGAEKVK
jgi:hypothetical protein